MCLTHSTKIGPCVPPAGPPSGQILYGALELEISSCVPNLNYITQFDSEIARGSKSWAQIPDSSHAKSWKKAMLDSWGYSFLLVFNIIIGLRRTVWSQFTNVTNQRRYDTIWVRHIKRTTYKYDKYNTIQYNLSNSSNKRACSNRFVNVILVSSM